MSSECKYHCIRYSVLRPNIKTSNFDHGRLDNVIVIIIPLISHIMPSTMLRLDLCAVAYGQTGRLIMFTQRNNHGRLRSSLYSGYTSTLSNHSHNAL